MRTNYQAADFALRYVRSRALAEPDRQLWGAELARATAGMEVSRIVDIGAGAGRFWQVFWRIWQPDVIVAVDTSLTMLQQGAADIAEVFRIVGDIDALPVANESSDVCFCSMVLHYSVDPIVVLSRLRDVLRPGGAVVIRTGTTETLGSFDFLRYFPTALMAEVAAMPEQATVEEWLVSAGFEDINLKIVTKRPHGGRWARLRQVYDRGFPSLRLVHSTEFVVGIGRYAARLAWEAMLCRTRIGEAALLVTARRP